MDTALSTVHLLPSTIDIRSPVCGGDNVMDDKQSAERVMLLTFREDRDNLCRMTELEQWVPRRKACKIIADALGEDQPISAYRLMRLAEAQQLKLKIFSAGKKSRYYISAASIKELLSAE